MNDAVYSSRYDALVPGVLRAWADNCIRGSIAILDYTLARLAITTDYARLFRDGAAGGRGLLTEPTRVFRSGQVIDRQPCVR